MMIEVAGRLASGPRPARDILFLATTAEEEGLIGAGYFAAHPTVPLDSIVAAINMDTVAIQPAGSPVAVMGRGMPALDAVDRRDGRGDGPPARHGRRGGRAGPSARTAGRSPAPACRRSWSAAPSRTWRCSTRFLDRPLSQARRPGRTAQLVLDGAAEDANLAVALGRRLADPALYASPQGAAR